MFVASFYNAVDFCVSYVCLVAGLLWLLLLLLFISLSFCSLLFRTEKSGSPFVGSPHIYIYRLSQSLNTGHMPRGLSPSITFAELIQYTGDVSERMR